MKETLLSRPLTSTNLEQTSGTQKGLLHEALEWLDNSNFIVQT